MKSKIKYVIYLLSFCFFASCGEDKCCEDKVIDKAAISKYESFIDERDNQEYKVVKVGNQLWFAQNLAYYIPGGTISGCSNYDEGRFDIKTVKPSNEDFLELLAKPFNDPKNKWSRSFQRRFTVQVPMWINMGLRNVTDIIEIMKSSPEGEKLYAMIEADLEVAKEKAKIKFGDELKEKTDAKNGGYSKVYGYLYSLEAAKKAIPEGWRLPSDDDWKRLEVLVGMNSQEADLMNEWRGANVGTYLLENKDGSFSAQVGGCRLFVAEKKYIRKDEYGYYWTSSLVNENDSIQLGIIRSLSIFHDKVWRGTTEIGKNEDFRYSVRCVKDL